MGRPPVIPAETKAYELKGFRSAVAALHRLGSGHPVHRRLRVGLEFAIAGHRDLQEMIEHHSTMARALGAGLDQLRRNHRDEQPRTDRVARPDGRPTPRAIRHRPVAVRRPRTCPRRRVLPARQKPVVTASTETAVDPLPPHRPSSRRRR